MEKTCDEKLTKVCTDTKGLYTSSDEVVSMLTSIDCRLKRLRKEHEESRTKYKKYTRTKFFFYRVTEYHVYGLIGRCSFHKKNIDCNNNSVDTINEVISRMAYVHISMIGIFDAVNRSVQNRIYVRTL